MKPTRWAALAVVGWLVAGLVQAGGGGDAKGLQGKWVGEGDGTTITLELKKDQFSMTFGEKGSFKGTFKVNAAKKPNEIDFMVVEGPDAKFTGKTSLGIFELSGDTLKWCGNQPGGKDRPTDFVDKGGHLSVTFKRSK